MLPYLKYYFSALNKYKVHSPFVFEFLNEVLEDDRFYHSFGVIENYRRNLLGNPGKIKFNKHTITINQLTKTKSISTKIGKLLFKTVHLYKPNTLLSLGANLGIASLYQAMPNSKSTLVNLESSPSVAQLTTSFLRQLGVKNVQITTGDIDETLSTTLKKITPIDQVYFNDFWGKELTLNYFETCAAHFRPMTIFIFREPYKSKEHLDFWQIIKAHKSVKLSIDLYDLGFLFFRSEQKEVAHYQLIEYWKKPWVVF